MVTLSTYEHPAHAYFWPIYQQQWWNIDILHETPTGHKVPYIYDLSVLVAREVKLELIAEAVARGDHDLFELTPREFGSQVLMNKIEYPQWDYDVSLQEIEQILLTYIYQHDIFFKNSEKTIKFSPIKGVW